MITITITKFKQIIVLLIFSYLILWLYAVLSQFWVVHGGASGTLNKFEFPVLLICCLILYFNPSSNRRIISKYSLAPPLTILGVYILYDIVYSFFSRSPRVSDFKNLMSLYSVSPLYFIAFCIAISIILIPVILSFIGWYVSCDGRKKAITILLKLFAATILLFVSASDYIYTYQMEKLRFIDWSNSESVKTNGRITSFLYYYNKRKDILSSLTSRKHFSIADQFYAKIPTNKRNVHILILESFVDPRQIKNFTYNRSPVSETLIPFLIKKKNFSIIKSPIYGGGTAQTEFEILTGIPALAQIESIDFNLFEGTATSSLVKILGEIGYHTMASVATKPVFYNSKLAYKGIGFSEINFLGGSKSYLEKHRDHYLFDGDLLSSNISYIQNYIDRKKQLKPLLNYILGMFGHVPFERNKQLRPDIISVHPENKLLKDMANQFYYRTKALGEFLKKLQQIDPSSIILITSDHLPPIFHNKDLSYTYNLYYNSTLLLNNFDPIEISGKKTYEISHIIWNLLNGSSNPLETNSLFANMSEENFYYSYILEAMGLETFNETKIFNTKMKKCINVEQWHSH